MSYLLLLFSFVVLIHFLYYNIFLLLYILNIFLPYVHFVVELANTYYTLHSERIYHDHQPYIYHNHRNGIDSCLHHQKDYIRGMYICQIDNGNFDKWLEQVDEYHKEHILILSLLSYLPYEPPVHHDKIGMCILYCSKESKKKTSIC